MNLIFVQQVQTQFRNQYLVFSSEAFKNTELRFSQSRILTIFYRSLCIENVWWPFSDVFLSLFLFRQHKRFLFGYFLYKTQGQTKSTFWNLKWFTLYHDCNKYSWIYFHSFLDLLVYCIMCFLCKNLNIQGYIGSLIWYSIKLNN